MQQEIIILNEVTQKEKDQPHMISHMWSIKYGINGLSTKQKQKQNKQTCVCQRGVERGGLMENMGLVDEDYYI